MNLSKNPLTIKVPGKLMVAGEYAVLVPYQKLMVMAVDRFVYATIEDSRENLLTLQDFDMKHMRWYFQNGDIHIDTTDERIQFVKQAMYVTYRYVSEQAMTPQAPISLTINSELDDESGKKYGLGSSAAVVTAVVSALLHQWLPKSPSPDLIFKLASIAHVKTQGNGSGADIAASTYGGILQYSSFQAEWLLGEFQETETLTALVEKNWRYLTVKRTKFPKDLSICIGWTGQPASTVRLVDEILALQKTNPDQFQQFLTSSKQAVNKIVKSIEDECVAGLLEGIHENRNCLATVGKVAGVEIETTLLAQLAEIAQDFGGAGKLSGAGGGDCGIAFIPSVENVAPMLRGWERVGIHPLTIGVSEEGAKIISQR